MLAQRCDPIRVAGATKIYPAPGGTLITALDSVSLRVRAGEMVALMGPSGGGKTTLLNLVGGIDLPTRGEVSIDGCITSTLGDDRLTRLRRDHIGIIFQSFNLLTAWNVFENVELPLRLQRKPHAEIYRRVLSALESVSMDHKADALPSELSGGEVQRVAIARAIVHQPSIVLADEPTGNLDSRNQDTILRILSELAAKGQTIVVATHSPKVAMSCNRTIYIEDGRVTG